MKTSRLVLAGLILILLALLLGVGGSVPAVRAQESTPTPTVDPLEEPPLLENPTEVELGRNLYWHWCMPCHGDVGQGLTEEWISVWEPDHQNCWARGCHAGNEGDLGFPIPTVVPAIVRPDRLAAFASVQAFSDYLRATHPPQRPGSLADREYRAIAVYVFSQNGRSLAEEPPLAFPTATPPVLASVTPGDEQPEGGGPAGLWLLPGAALLAAALLLGRFLKKK